MYLIEKLFGTGLLSDSVGIELECYLAGLILDRISTGLVATGWDCYCTGLLLDLFAT